MWGLWRISSHQRWTEILFCQETAADSTKRLLSHNQCYQDTSPCSSVSTLSTAIRGTSQALTMGTPMVDKLGIRKGVRDTRKSIIYVKVRYIWVHLDNKNKRKFFSLCPKVFLNLVYGKESPPHLGELQAVQDRMLCNSCYFLPTGTVLSLQTGNVLFSSLTNAILEINTSCSMHIQNE